MSLLSFVQRAAQFVLGNFLSKKPETQAAATPLTTSQPTKAAERPVVATVEPQTATTAEAPAPTAAPDPSTPPAKPEEVKTAAIKPPTGKITAHKEHCVGCSEEFEPTKKNPNLCPRCVGNEGVVLTTLEASATKMAAANDRPRSLNEELRQRLYSAIARNIVEGVGKRCAVERACDWALKGIVHRDKRGERELQRLEATVNEFLTQAVDQRDPKKGLVMSEEEATAFIAARRPKVVAPAAAQKNVVAAPPAVSSLTPLEEERLIKQAIDSFKADKGLPKKFTLQKRKDRQLVFLLPNRKSITRCVDLTPKEKAAKEAAERADAEGVRERAAARANADRRAAELKKLHDKLVAAYIARQTLPEGATASVDPKDASKVTFEFPDGRPSIAATLPKAEKKAKEGKSGGAKPNKKGQGSGRKAA